jgi:hypothetical protein
MSAASNSNNVISLAMHRFAREARRTRRALPYLLWYPGVGFVKSTAPASVTQLYR